MLRGDGGIHSAGVDLEPVFLVGGQHGDGAVGRGPKLVECALEAVAPEYAVADDLGELALNGVAAEKIHLATDDLGSDVTLCEDQPSIELAWMWRDALRIALDGYWSGESVDRL